MERREETFAVGDRVTWANKDLRPISRYVEAYGMKQFRVIDVRQTENPLPDEHVQRVALEIIDSVFKRKVCLIGIHPPAIAWVNGAWLKKL